MTRKEVKFIMCGVVVNRKGSTDFILGNKATNDLVVRDREDMKHFKNTTTNGVVIMGRGTFESMKRNPLPNRVNIVIGNKERVGEVPDNVRVFEDIESAVDFAVSEYSDKEIFVIGGGKLYKSFMQLARLCQLKNVRISELIITYCKRDEIAENFINNPNDFVFICENDFRGYISKIKPITFDDDLIIDEDDPFRIKVKHDGEVFTLREHYSSLVAAKAFSEELKVRNISVEY